MEWNAATFWVGFGFGPFKRCQREWVLFLVTFDAFRAAQPCWLLSDVSDSLRELGMILSVSCFGLLSPNPIESIAFLRRPLSVGNSQYVLESARWHGKKYRGHCCHMLGRSKLHLHWTMKDENIEQCENHWRSMFFHVFSLVSFPDSHVGHLMKNQVLFSFSFNAWPGAGCNSGGWMLCWCRHDFHQIVTNQNQRFSSLLLVAWWTLCTNNGGRMGCTFQHFGASSSVRGYRI